jgi:hypothetical protein
MFGKRKPQSDGNAGSRSMPLPPHPGPDDDGVARVIPKELWDGPTGALLRTAGMTPDDPGNLVLTQELFLMHASTLR